MLVFDQLRKNDPQLRVLTWCVLTGLLTLLAGLWYLQVINSRRYVENQRSQAFRTVRIPAVRGKILDRNGVPLAENRPNYNISLYLEELPRLFKNEWARTKPNRRMTRNDRLHQESLTRYRVVSNLVQHIAKIMQQPLTLDYGAFLRHYTNQLALPMPVLTNLTPAQLARFQEFPRNLPGVDIEMQSTRTYLGNAVGAHVLGFLMPDNTSREDEDAYFNFRLPDYRGLVGIEGVFDVQLRGHAGVKSVLVNNLGYKQSESVWVESEPGHNVVLTIDAEIQRVAEQALREAPSARPKTCGAVVVLDCRSGDILALASTPTFDPNRFIPRVSPEYWAELSDERLSPQKNRATQENYAPGSIFKIIIGLASLEAGLDPEQTIYNPPNPADPAHGYILVGRRPIKDLAQPGEYNFRRAFIKSCNTYFITNGLRFGAENIVFLGERLHLGERVGLPTRQEVSGIFPQPIDLRPGHGWSDGVTANLCIGQGPVSVTPLQMAVMVAAIANGGKVLLPRLVQRIEAQRGDYTETVTQFPPARVRNELGVSHRSLDLVREAMLADVEDAEGTGKGAYIPGFRVCGKTGTAQVMNSRNETTDHTTWFASYAPFENPRYAVVAMVESGSSGGGTCAPVVKKIYQAIQKQEQNLNRPKAAGLAQTN